MNNLANLIGIMIVSYVVGGVIYFWYHAFKIARAVVGVKNRIYFFSLMLSNPFWRTLEDKTLSAQAPELNAYISKVERQKYFFIAGIIFIVVSTVVLMRSLTWLSEH
jgi:hypothetical protein